MANRREFLAFTATTSALATFSWRSEARTSDVALRPVADRTTGESLLKLPPDFSYVSHGWTGEAMTDGNRVPPAHDGMGAFAQADGRTVHLVRNHEITSGPLIGDVSVYDPRSGGGTTTLKFDLDKGEWLESRVSLAGTYKNCAGGPTPWGSWLTCEEAVVDPEPDGVERPHGFAFEVPADGVGDPQPLTGLGRFEHEAAAVDPVSGIVYLTEDEYESGLYRFVPDGDTNTGQASLRGPGRLQMLAIDSRPKFAGRWPVGLTLGTAWVDIDNPDRSVYRQGHARGGMRFDRLEGCWWDEGHLYFVSTNGGRAGQGQIWEMDAARDRLRLLYESPGKEVLSGPDNLVMLRNGNLMVCEDGAGPNRLSMLSTSGLLEPLAQNNMVLDGVMGLKGDYRGGEWAGVCQAGDWVFANVQRPGVTFAITGPWDQFAKGLRP